MKHLDLLNSVKSIRVGDVLVILLSIIGIIWLFANFWQQTPANRLQIMQGNTVVGTYSLNQTRDIHVHGAKGESVIQIADGRARFMKSPCTNQYCVHQGWLNRAGQAAVCLPNEVIVQLLGAQKPFDSLSY
jgi:hypothetical protein